MQTGDPNWLIMALSPDFGATDRSGPEPRQVDTGDRKQGLDSRLALRRMIEANFQTIAHCELANDAGSVECPGQCTTVVPEQAFCRFHAPGAGKTFRCQSTAFRRSMPSVSRCRNLPLPLRNSYWRISVLNNRGPWAALIFELWKRLWEPLKQPSFTMYFLLALILGAMGVWVALVEGIVANWQNDTQEPFFRALLTFFPAIGSLACVQVIIVEDSQKSIRALFSLLLIVFLSLAIVSGVAYTQNTSLSFRLTAIGTVLAVLSWWLANSDQESFKETTDPAHPIGGSVENELAGDTEGFAT